MVNNAIIQFVNEFKYLGHVVSNSQLDDADIHRERKNFSVVICWRGDSANAQ